MMNRTSSKLYDIKNSLPALFNIEILESVDQVDAAKPVSLVVSCVPADKPIDDNLLNMLERMLHQGILIKHGSFTPTLLEATYKPRLTPVMRIAEEKFEWNVIPGVEMLVNQGERQFELHTGFTPPYSVIHHAVVSE